MSSRPVVIITRPVEQAAEQARQLQEWGYEVALLPALTIQPVIWSEQTRLNLQTLSQFDLVHFSSPNAIRYAFEPLASDAYIWAEHTHIALMGSGSREAMRRWCPNSEQSWVSPPDDSALDSEALIQVLEQKDWFFKVRRALLIKGQGGRQVLADWLRSRAIEVHCAEVYRREWVTFTPEVERQLESLAKIKNCVWLLTSSEGTLALGQVLRQLPSDWQDSLKSAVVLTTHARVASAARESGFINVKLGMPGEVALKAALESHYD